MRWLLPGLLASQIAGILAADRAALCPRGALALGLAAGLAGLSARRRPALRAALALVLAFAGGWLALAERLEGARASRSALPCIATVEGRVASIREFPGGGLVVLRRVRSVDGPPLPRGLRIEVALARGGQSLLAHGPGSWIRARLRIAAPRPRRNPGGGDLGQRLAREGIGGVARLEHPLLQATVAPGPAAGSWLHALRRRIAARLEAEGQGGALLAALSVGEPRALSGGTRDALARLGLAHLLAVSGLHLGLVALLAFGAARPILARILRRRPLGDARRGALFAALVAALGYAVLTGLAIPVRRALVFLFAWAAVALRGRPTRRAAPLVLAAMLLLAADPSALFALGAQLSFAATAALLWSPPPAPLEPARGAVERARHHLRDLLRTSAGAAGATAPLVAHAGRSAAALGGLANLVAVPVTGLLLLPMALACAAGAALLPGQAGPFLAMAARLAGGFLSSAVAAASWLPAPAAAPAAPLALAASATFALLAVRARRTALRIALAVLAGFAPGCLPPPAIQPVPPRVVFFDVGQGDAVLVQTQQTAVLVDGGTAIPGGVDLGERIVVPALRALGVARLDLLVASHADLDHRGGLPAVLRALPVGRIWLPLHGRADPAFRELLAEARRRGVRVEERGAGGAPFRGPGLAVVPLWPPPDAAVGPSENDGSLVLRVDATTARVLLPGDIEADAERALVAEGADLRADVLKLAHHGSRTSSTGAFLDAIRPRVAVASAPPAGRFGMPHPAVRARLVRRGIALTWTGRDGAILVGLVGALPIRRFSIDDEAAPLAARSARSIPRRASADGSPAGRP